MKFWQLNKQTEDKNKTDKEIRYDCGKFFSASRLWFFLNWVPVLSLHKPVSLAAFPSKGSEGYPNSSPNLEV